MADQPTLAQVAAAAGVSPATASRVLTGSVRVSTSARRQVHEAISRLGYVRRRAPRGSSPRRSDRLVAAVVCDPIHRVFAEPFYARLLAAIEDALGKHGIATMVMSAAATSVTTVATPLVTGAVAVCCWWAPGRGIRSRSPSPPPASRCAASGRPPDGLDLPYIDVDNADGARQAAEHLLLQGRRHITMIGGPATLPAARQRSRGSAPAQRGRRVRRARGVRGLHPRLGRARHPVAAAAHAEPGCDLRRLGHDGGGGDRRAARRRAARCPTTWPWSASTTRRSPGTPGRRSPPCGSRSRSSPRPACGCCCPGCRIAPEQNPILPAELVVRESA